MKRSAAALQRLWVAACLVVLGTAAVLLVRFAPVQTDLLALLPATERNPVAEQAVKAMGEAAGNRAVFLVGHADPAKARVAAGRLARTLEQSRAFARVQLEVAASDPRALAQPHREFRFGLLADPDRDALASGSFDATQWLMRRLSDPLRLGLGGGLAQDPFGFFGNFLAALPYRHLRLEFEDGVLVAREGANGREYVLVLADLPGSAYDDTVQRAVVEAVEDGEKAAADAAPGIEILRTGAVFFAAAARASAQRDVDLIGAGSIAGIVLLMLLVFRSLRPMLLGLLTVAIGLVAAVSTTLLAHGKLHLLTLVFGASLIGEAIDYSIQYFGAYAAAGRDWDPRRGLLAVRPGLTLALATSALGYGALLFMPFPAVREIALFALAGLVGAYLAVMFVLPRLLTTPFTRDLSRLTGGMARFVAWWSGRVGTRAALAIALAFLVACAPGWLRLAPDDDVRALSSRPEALLQQEQRIRALTGMEISTRFFLVEGESPEAVLRAEEALAGRLRALAAKHELRGFQAVSSFVPSQARQEENRALLRKALPNDPKEIDDAFQVAGLRSGIGLELERSYRESQGTVLKPEAWLESPAAVPFRHLWLGRTQSGYASVVVPMGAQPDAPLAGAALGLPKVTLVDKAASVSRLFAQYRAAFGYGLGIALLVVLAVLAVRYRVRKAAAVLVPALLGMAAALAIAGYRGAPLTLFSMMALMLVLGVGVNYAIFLVEGRGRSGATGIAVLLCAATTVLSFGLLAFSGTPALSGFGSMLLPGVAFAVLLAPLALSLAPAEAQA